MEAATARLSPPQQLREQLEDMKRNGLSFDYAWKIAQTRIRWPVEKRSRAEWREVIEAQRDVWESCYRDTGEPVNFAALLPALMPDDEWEPADAHVAA